MANAVAEFFGIYVPERVRLGKMATKTVREYRIQWTAHLLPKLGKLKVAEVNRKHISRAVAGKPPTTRNRLLALVSRLFTYFEQQELREQNTSPVKGIERATLEPRDRVLTAAELSRLAKALAAYDGNPAAIAAIRIAAVSGLRIGEIVGMEWEHVDFETGRLTLPQTKTGRRVHTLPAAGIDIIRELPERCPWIFNSRGLAPIGYRSVRFHFQQVCAAAGIEGVRLHDLRRSYMTAAAASGVSSHILQQILGHKTGVAASRYVREIGDSVHEARERTGNQIAAAMKIS